MNIRMLCALIFAMVVALFLLAGAARSDEKQRRVVSPGCKADEESAKSVRTKSVPALTDFSVAAEGAPLRASLFLRQ